MNRIDELHSLMDFLNPAVLGPLFRFNREFYELDERGRPIGCRNLDVLHQRIKPFMLRRRKANVETELPERTDRNHFVPLHDLQKQNYAVHESALEYAAYNLKRAMAVVGLEMLLAALAGWNPQGDKSASQAAEAGVKCRKCGASRCGRLRAASWRR